MSVMLPRVGVSGGRDSVPQREVSGLLRGTPPTVYDTSRGESLESDEGVLAHCNSSALCVPSEDPGGKLCLHTLLGVPERSCSAHMFRPCLDRLPCHACHHPLSLVGRAGFVASFGWSTLDPQIQS